MEFNGCLLGQLLLHTKSQPRKFSGKPRITEDTLRVPIFLDRTFLRHCVFIVLQQLLPGKSLKRHK
jgi:hypothetical protein